MSKILNTQRSMEATFKLASNFKGLIEILSTFADTINMRYEGEGISIQALDSGNISMLNIVLRSDQFTEYKSKGSGIISLSTASLKPLLRSMKDRDGLRIRFAGQESNEVDLILIDGDRKNKYSIKLLNVDIDMLNMDVEMEHAIFISTGKTAMTKILSDIKNLDGDEVKFVVSEDRLHIVVNSDQCNLKIKPSREIMRVMTPTEDGYVFDVRFASKYIQYISKMMTICQPRMNLKLDTNCPLLLEMTIRTDDGEESVSTAKKTAISTMRFYLAPKLDD
jgi:proliferating cell nuclear antigen PCNA